MREHDARQRGDKPGVFQLGFGEGQRGADLFDARTGLGDVLGAGTLLDELEAFGGLGGAGLGNLELGL